MSIHDVQNKIWAVLSNDNSEKKKNNKRLDILLSFLFIACTPAYSVLFADRLTSWLFIDTKLCLPVWICLPETAFTKLLTALAKKKSISV